MSLQAFLLVAQARRPLAIADDQDQAAAVPGADLAVFAGRRFQLGFEQGLQPGETRGFGEKRFQWLGFTQQNCGSAGWQGTKGHLGREPAIAKRQW